MFYLIVKDNGGRIQAIESYSNKQGVEAGYNYWSSIKGQNGQQKYIPVKTQVVKN